MIEVKAGYKETEVGVIPEDWEVKPLGQISDVFMGQSPSGTTYNKNGEGVALINGPTEFTDVSPVKVQWTTQPTKICKADDLLICVRGSSTGRMNIADDEYCIGRGVAAIRAKSSSNTVYLTNQIHLGIEKLLTLSVGSTFPNIDGKSIRSIQIPLPPTLAEQTAIATVLSDTDALIERLEKLIAKKIAIKQGAMQLLLAGKKRLPGFSGEWEVEKIKNISSITTGTKNTQDKIDDAEYPFFVRSSIVERINSYSFDGEAVLTAGDGVGTGKIFHYINGKFDFHQRVYKMSHFDEKVNGYFFYLFFSNYFLKRIMAMTAKSSVDSVRMEMIAEMPIPLPPRSEQTAIAAILSDMDAEIESLEQTRNKYTMIKQGMMQQLLTGRIRIHGTN